MTAYYNENDPKAAAWLRELIKLDLIAPGEVDERSIEDVRPSDVREFTQCHFFAGIGVWSYALRQAGWSDSRQVWTGSCPCQPFSGAGKKGGVTDERHLWPAFFHLINECSPRVIFGEQVASKDGLAWLDLVQTDLEGTGHTFGALDLCAAGFGAPHIRQRLYFVADGQLVIASSPRRQGNGLQPLRAGRDREGPHVCATGSSSVIKLGNALLPRLEGYGGNVHDWYESRRDGENASGSIAAPGPTNGHWREADWLYCRDKKYRAVEPGTFPLVNGAPQRVGRLRGYGNALVAPVAQAFIEAYCEGIQ